MTAAEIIEKYGKLYRAQTLRRIEITHAANATAERRQIRRNCWEITDAAIEEADKNGIDTVWIAGMIAEYGCN